MESIKNKATKSAIVTLVFISIFFLAACINESKDNTIANKKENIEGIHAAFYNSDGSKISISTTKGRLALLDSNLKLITIAKVSEGNANSSFFSIDNKYIITGGSDKQLSVWNSDNLSSYKHYNFRFNSWTSIHGYNTLGGCGEGGKVIFYNKLSKDTIVYNLEKEGAFHCYYINVDTSFVVSSGFSGYELNLLNKQKVHKYTGHKDWVYCIMPDNAGRRIVTSSRDSTIKVFDRFSEKCLATSSKMDGAVYVTCFNKEDNSVAASTANGTVYFLDTTLHSIKMKIKAFTTRINTIHYSPSGKRILVGSEEGGAKIFSTKDGVLLHEFYF